MHKIQLISMKDTLKKQSYCSHIEIEECRTQKLI